METPLIFLDYILVNSLILYNFSFMHRSCRDMWKLISVQLLFTKKCVLELFLFFLN